MASSRESADQDDGWMGPMWRALSTSPEQTVAIAVAVAGHVVSGDVVALNGELGSGKTQFVRGLAVGLGLDDSAVSSPTFVLMHEYADREGRTVLVHVDAYRLKSLEDTESIGWDPVRAEFSDGTVVAIEWADRLSDQFGPNVLTVQLDHRDDQQRLVTMRPTGTWAERMPRLVRCLDQVVDGDAARTKDSEAVYRCPICSGSVRGGAGSFPFCSGRCRTIDLHRWFRGDYRISRPTDHIDPHSSD